MFSLVERVMDTAITKWDEMPEEKKSKAIANEGGRHAEVVLSTDEEHDDRAKIISRLATGVVFGTGFGLGYFAFGIGWMVWPFVFLGALPFAHGVLKGIKALARGARIWRDRPMQLERTLLRVAGELGGTVTVVQAASRAELPLDEVQQTLDRMTLKGYVTQRIRESGVIEYEFPSLASDQG
ncbi:MAG: hypothetical protein ACOC0E_07555 [Spirochaetota bacterium]